MQGYIPQEGGCSLACLNVINSQNLGIFLFKPSFLYVIIYINGLTLEVSYYSCWVSINHYYVC